MEYCQQYDCYGTSEEITLIIPTHNDLSHLKLLLRSIRMFTYAPYRILILADRPAKEVIDWLNASRYIYMTVDFGDLYLTWNHALHVADTEKVCFLTADCVVSPFWLLRMLRYSTAHNIVTCQTIDAHNGFWGTRRMHYNCGDTPEVFDMEKFLNKANELKLRFHGSFDHEGWFIPWLVNRKLFLYLYDGWCSSERHPASMDQFTYDKVFYYRTPYLRALDACIYHF